MTQALEHRFSIASQSSVFAKADPKQIGELFDRIAAGPGLELGDLPEADQRLILEGELAVSAGEPTSVPVGVRDPRVEDAALDSENGVLALADQPLPTVWGQPAVPGIPWTDAAGVVHPFAELDEGTADTEAPEEDPAEGEGDDSTGGELPSADDDGWVGV